ncbi:MAG TPA: carbohydrate ABC transporter permease [Thermomicrobiales bacterium]|jgi:multiple sugar transport system permease protein/putative aldouronate transport system permease protein|nr:carbohydrate ABC transporter permease [Thermomicrobiales bacterium]
MSGHFTRDTGADRTFTIVNYALLCLFLVSVAYPLIYVVSASMSSPSAVISGRMWLWPVDFTLAGYRAVFDNPRILTGFKNSAFYTLVGTTVSVTLTILAAYPLSRKDLTGRGPIMFLFLFTLLFGGGLIPTYLVVRETGLLNTRWALIIPAALSVYNMIITRTFFQATIPDELLEAAQLDGVSDFRFLLDVVLPLSMPIVAVNALFYAVAQWNQYFNALIYLTDQGLFPLQLILREILIQNQVDLSKIGDIAQLEQRQHLADLLKYSLIVVASLPVLVIYPFVQRHFVRGVLIGSLKG